MRRASQFGAVSNGIAAADVSDRQPVSTKFMSSPSQPTVKSRSRVTRMEPAAKPAAKPAAWGGARATYPSQRPRQLWWSLMT
jgi:hypothetical protein